MAFTSPSFNWTHDYEPDWVIAPLEMKAPERNYNESILTAGKHYAVNAVQDHHMYKLLIDSTILGLNNLTGGAAEASYISIARGLFVRMHSRNAQYRSIFSYYGVNPDNAYSCIVNFLLQPKPEIFQGITDIHDQIVHRDESVVMIGLHIRKGDNYLDIERAKNISQILGRFPPHYRCASTLEKQILAQNSSKKVMWYLLSDSIALRRIAKRFFGPKLVTSLDLIEHSAKGTRDCEPYESQCRVTERGFQRAAAEWWLFGYMDYFVIGDMSGYGKSAAMRSLRTRSIFMVTKSTDCSPMSFSSPASMADSWSGL